MSSARATLNRSVRGAVMGAVRRSAVVKDRLRPPDPGVAVLIYHRVGARTPMAVDLPAAQFDEQMAQIAPTAVTLDDALDDLAVAPAPGAELGPNPVVVTFDDGTRDVVEEALPICVEHKVPLLLYVATRFVEEQLDFPNDGKPVSWAALADGLSTGYLHIGSHTHGHSLLDRLEPARVDDELDRSIGLIQDRLGCDPAHFAYPKALPGNAYADAAVRKRFRSAAVDGTRVNVRGATDPWALARSPIQVSDTPAWFDAKVRGGLSLEDDVRHLVNRIRYRGDLA